MKSYTKMKLQFRWLTLLGSGLAGLGLVNAPAQETTVEVLTYWAVQGQLDAVKQLQTDFETANPGVKIHFTYVPFGELVSRTLQMAAVRKPPAISVIDNPDVLRVAKAGVLKDISAAVVQLQLWNDLYPGFGIVTVPVPKEGGKPVVPLGGEVWCVLKGDPKVEQAAFKFIQFTQEPDRLRKLCDTFDYISSIRSVAKQQGDANSELRPFVDQMDAARARSQDGGAKYPEISLAARTAIQRALAGQVSVEEALKEAAAKIKPLLPNK
jgi:ABC-type glycerol-3-phosphate transport system substrate-binding protein